MRFSGERWIKPIVRRSLAFLLLIHGPVLAASPLSFGFMMSGATEQKATDNQAESITAARQQGLDLSIHDSSAIRKETSTQPSIEDTFAIVYTLRSTLRIFLSQYTAEPEADPQQVQLLPLGATYAGLRFAPHTYLLLGYVPCCVDGQPDPENSTLRYSNFPGLHLQFQHPHAGSIQVTPLLFIDPPGRSMDAPWFEGTVRQNLSQRQAEGNHDALNSADRFAHQLRYSFQIDWFSIGLGYRTSSFKNTGPSDRSSLLLNHASIQAGMTTDSIRIFLGATRASGSLTEAGSPSLAVDGMEYRISVDLFHRRTYSISIFAMKTEADRLPGHLEEKRLGFTDYGASSIDLPLLGSNYIHPLPCVPAPEDRCDGVIRSEAIAHFRNAGSYGSLTLIAQHDRWRIALRPGILVPFRYTRTDEGGQRKKEIYSDFSEVALELQLSPDFTSSTFALTYSRLYKRDDERRRRLLQAQSFSALFRIPLEFRS